MKTRTTIRIRKHLRDKFFKEKHPVKLVNELLDSHYQIKIAGECIDCHQLFYTKQGFNNHKCKENK